MEKKIRGRVKNQMEKTQREYYLNEQLKAIQKELGEIDEGKDELTSLSKAISDAKMPKLAKEKMFIRVKKVEIDEPHVRGSYSCKKLFRLDDRVALVK